MNINELYSAKEKAAYNLGFTMCLEKMNKTHNLSPADIDRVICEWSTELLVVLTEEQLNELVDRLCKLLGLLS